MYIRWSSNHSIRIPIRPAATNATGNESMNAVEVAPAKRATSVCSTYGV